MVDTSPVGTEDRIALSGGEAIGRRSGGVTELLGLPYGAPTGGQGRFRAPRPAAGWTGRRPAHEYGPACPQPPIRDNLVIDPAVERAMFGLSDEPQSEDCLSLNVWTPAADGAARPVMVSLHGGGFKSGSGSARCAPWFHGARLAATGDVVVVTLNHRIGILGHLHLPDLPSSGNAGLLDLVAALHWIQDNASRLGGDPKRVTVFGESGGGGKVMALMVMPCAAGLFQRAVCQSGTLAWLSDAEAAGVGEAVLTHLGVDSPAGLHALDVAELVAAGAAVTRAGMRFGPVIDGVTLPHDAITAIEAGAGADVPLIIGVTAHEATAFLGGRPATDWATLDQRFGDHARHYRDRRPHTGAAEALVDLTTDEMFRRPAIQAAMAKARAGTAPVFMYEFAWPTPVLGGVLGAAHGVDVAFPFDNTDVHPATAGSPEAGQLAAVVRDACVAFARHGDPNHPALPVWPPYGRDGETLVFDTECRLEPRPPAL
jgi:para-nitrobenzyl esterase